jgi:hypothetical protein
LPLTIARMTRMYHHAQPFLLRQKLIGLFVQADLEP